MVMIRVSAGQTGQDDDMRHFVECHDGETVLEALRRNGNRPKFGCRRGGCAVCKVNVVEGSFRYERPIADSVLPAEEQLAGKVCLACRAVPESDLTLSLDYTDSRPNPLLALYRDVVAQDAKRRHADASPGEQRLSGVEGEKIRP